MTMKRDLLLLPLLAFFLLTTACKDRKNTIRIATKPMTEQFILGEMLKLLIEQDTGLAVEITKGIGGGTSNIHPAMLKGEFDIYPEYTGTGWLVVLKKDTSGHPIRDFEKRIRTKIPFKMAESVWIRQHLQSGGRRTFG